MTDSGIGLDVPAPREAGDVGLEGEEPPSDCAATASSSFFLRPNPIPQLPAKLARRLVAVGPVPTPAPSPRPARELDEVVAGDGIAPIELRVGSTECDVVRRRCVCDNRLTIPPVGESSGDGTYDPAIAPGIPIVSEPEPEPDDGVDASVDTACSEIAVVGIAFATAPGVAPNGIRPLENWDEDEPRDARDPGRSGDGWAGRWIFWG